MLVHAIHINFVWDSKLRLSQRLKDYVYRDGYRDQIVNMSVESS